MGTSSSRPGRVATLALVAIGMLLPRDVGAHQDPPQCAGTASGLELLVSPSTPVTECGRLRVGATLLWTGQCLIGGELVIVTPDGVEHTMTIPCLGPATVDQDGCLVGQGSSATFEIGYDVTPDDVARGGGEFVLEWRKIIHSSPGNVTEKPDTRKVAFTVEACPSDTFCTDWECVAGEGAASPGSCVVTDVSDSVCPDDLFCSDVVCDDEAGACVTTDVSADQCPGDFCTSTTCNEALDECEATDVSAQVCPGTSCTTETCNAATSTCDSVPLPDGTECGDGLFCNGDDTCVAGACVGHTGDPCAGPDGDLDCAESCDEAADACTAFDPAGSVCRAAAGACDLAETCTGASASCPADEKSTATCRAATDVCDVAERCSGVDDECPADGFAASGTECRAGSGDACDPGERCTGTSAECPADAVAPAGTECRAAGGDCDVPETCDGVAATCPPDVLRPAGATCREAGDECDAAETCTGADVSCPEDALAPDGTSCAEGNECLVGEPASCRAGTCVLGTGCPIVRIADLGNAPVGPDDTLDVTIDIPADTPGVGRVIVRVDGRLTDVPGASGLVDAADVQAAAARGGGCTPGKRVLRTKPKLIGGSLRPGSVATLSARLSKRGRRCLARGDLTIGATFEVKRRLQRRKRPSVLDRFERSAVWKSK